MTQFLYYYIKHDIRSIELLPIMHIVNNTAKLDVTFSSLYIIT
jgi:hypothetical protein